MEVLTVCKLKTFSRVCYLFPDAHNITCVTNRRADYNTDLSGFRFKTPSHHCFYQLPELSWARWSVTHTRAICGFYEELVNNYITRRYKQTNVIETKRFCDTGSPVASLFGRKLTEGKILTRYGWNSNEFPVGFVHIRLCFAILRYSVVFFFLISLNQGSRYRTTHSNDYLIYFTLTQ